MVVYLKYTIISINARINENYIIFINLKYIIMYLSFHENKLYDMELKRSALIGMYNLMTFLF